MNDTSNYFSYDTFDSDSNRRKNNTTLPCAHCLKAQLNCDGSRPCQSCFKRGLTATCSDAVRKKIKHQQQEEVPTTFPQANSFLDSMSAPMDQFIDTAQLLNFSLAELGFGSETAGLEYGVIGNMLQNPLTDLPTSSTSTTNSIIPNSTTTMMNTANTTAQQQTTTSASFPYAPQQVSTSPAATAQYNTLLPMVSSRNHSNNNHNNNNHNSNNNHHQFRLQHSNNNNNNKNSNNSNSNNNNNNNSMTPPDNKSSPIPTVMKRDSVSSAGSQPNNNKRKYSNYDKTPEAVYNGVRRPFNYAEGFHYLIQYVREKMGREDLMRISRALALFRPSFLALIMNLTEEDLVFMEKCLQRTLLEYEKLISFSGTPTVVWRRTGEICLVGKEFSLLTQWQRDLLLSKKTYIYELMDNGSAVEYWEKFATHAFDNTDKACTFSCILRTPSHKAVPCTFCFTIKRDIFDLPSVIVGNFLPLLS
ncbi:hypothetical protein INT45_003260 [Circinella minor]|uniref:Zn(2)-C6 fungal-type domain-containing protein n=1 Tax=Circinella minor TaxID=1195481 RepID=A0A8H7SAF8_9FUNG|nr:hypothetical protein INT45_003260 [Circinella minor]